MNHPEAHSLPPYFDPKELYLIHVVETQQVFAQMALVAGQLAEMVETRPVVLAALAQDVSAQGLVVEPAHAKTPAALELGLVVRDDRLEEIAPGFHFLATMAALVHSG